MKKERWYAITWQTKDSQEVIVGFRQALIFRRKEDAEAEYKKSSYSKSFKRENGEIWKYQIRRIYI